MSVLVAYTSVILLLPVPILSAAIPASVPQELQAMASYAQVS